MGLCWCSALLLCGGLASNPHNAASSMVSKLTGHWQHCTQVARRQPASCFHCCAKLRSSYQQPKVTLWLLLCKLHGTHSAAKALHACRERGRSGSSSGGLGGASGGGQSELQLQRQRLIVRRKALQKKLAEVSYALPAHGTG